MNSGDSKDVVTSYLEHVNCHDIPGALGHLSDRFRLELEGGTTLTKQDMAQAMGWDAGTGGRIEWRVVSEGASEIVVEGQETNEFLRLLGFPPLPFSGRFRLDDTGLIVSQHHQVHWTGVSMEQALAPAVAWAKQHAPNELEKAYPGGRMSYSERQGRLWVALLRRWRRATEEP